MKNTSLILTIVIALLLLTARAFAQGSILARGNPPLTQEMVGRLITVYESVLDIKFNASQRARFQQGTVQYWTGHNDAGISNSLSNLKYYSQTDELASLRSPQNQQVLIESFRRDAAATNDPVSIVLVEAFDAAHPGRRSETRARGFQDLIGVWRRSDALIADRNPYGTGQFGASYTDSSVLEIKADGSLKMVRAHEHFTNGCSRMDGSTEYGTVTERYLELVFQIKSGSSETTDRCINKSQRQTIKPRTDVFVWSIRSNPNDQSPTMLCLNQTDGKAVCYEKQ